MHALLEEYLFEKYPKLFRQKDLPMTQTCMCWGICCDDGWFGIIDRTCEKIQKFIDNHPGEWCEFVQVKEKLGTLRMYQDGGNEFFDECEDEAEKESRTTCEKCGSTQNIGRTSGWISHLCETHLKERECPTSKTKTVKDSTTE